VELTAYEICDWFECNIGKSMMIQKKDQNDTDQVEFMLDDVSLMRYSDTLDDYISPEAIVLRGDGIIETHDGQKQKLPDHIFEIPFNGSIQGFQEENENKINIQTENAHYSITLQ
jgi:hypothetical protein